ncbi:MAG: hypothetical protein N4A33_04075 [Bacteriovoracaceae bacterium]|jgi:hypothetical protein|nr:hypothetical protein [Bacteriovoracaceae bacterium]
MVKFLKTTYCIQLLVAISILTASCENIDLKSIGGNLNSDDVNSLVDIPAGPPNLSSDEKWVLVPANAGGMGLPAFYVMQYEAKAMLEATSTVNPLGRKSSGSPLTLDLATHKPVSVADNNPWVWMNATQAASECESLGSGFALISNPEWMAIARDVEQQPENWTGGSVGSGCLYRGNSGETTNGDGTDVTHSCGYDGSNPDAGVVRDRRSKLRLSNGKEIYDLAGNVLEWVDWDKDTVGFQTTPSVGSCWGAYELPAVSCPALVDEDYNSFSSTLTTTQGIGKVSIDSAGSHGLFRGGSYDFYTNNQAGIYMVHFYSGYTISSSSTYGFRCVYRPTI